MTQQSWPRFPYRRLRSRYDAFLPMAYWTSHARGAARVHTRKTIRLIRARTGTLRSRST